MYYTLSLEVFPMLTHTQELLSIMSRLRDPKTGCPWDIEQNFETIAPYTIEEAYEVAEAIAQGDKAKLKGELGDLLFQVVFYTQMSQEEGGFDFEDVAKVQCDKMIRRHPHVFGEAHIATAEAQTENWEKLKKEERKAAGEGGLLADIPLGMPALLRAQKLQKRAVSVGFDWPEGDDSGVFAKIDEEVAEVREAYDAGDKAALQDEIGDALFALVNLARRNGINPEEALRGTNRKFERRFSHMEAQLHARGMAVDAMKSMDLAGLDVLWDAAKAAERGEHAA
jgi:ATP diphosphatase